MGFISFIAPKSINNQTICLWNWLFTPILHAIAYMCTEWYKINLFVVFGNRIRSPCAAINTVYTSKEIIGICCILSGYAMRSMNFTLLLLQTYFTSSQAHNTWYTWYLPVYLWYLYFDFYFMLQIYQRLQQQHQEHPSLTQNDANGKTLWWMQRRMPQWFIGMK